MVRLLNEDLAREYQAIIAYVDSQTLKGAIYTDIAGELETHAAEELAHALKVARQIDYFGGTQAVQSKPVNVSAEAKAMTPVRPRERASDHPELPTEDSTSRCHR
jgi:bacterioferritin